MNLSEEQLAAVISPAKNILVSACAGSGKTRVLVERIKHLMALGASPSEICCVTFTTAAAKEIEKRLSGGGEAIKLGHSGTLHALLLKSIRREFAFCGYSSAPTVATEAVADELLEECISDTRCSTIPVKELKKVIALDVPKQTLSKAETCAAHYHQKLIEAGLIDYDGILRLGLRLAVAGRLPKFSHLICDEMQDSSEMDFRIYSHMAVQTRMYVGDDNQQIYGFRGACSGFEKLCKGGGDCGWNLYKLQTCYRCSEEICQAADAVLNFIPDRLFKQTISSSGPRGPVVVERFENVAAETARIATLMNQRNEDGSCPFNEAAVLLRTNALADFYRDALKGFGIRVREQRSPQKLDGWAKAQAIIAYYCDPTNDHAAYNYAKAYGGDELAKKVKRTAAVGLCPISEVIAMGSLPAKMDFGNALKVMASIGILPATIEAIEKLHLEANGDLHDLLLAMREDDPDQSGEGVYVGTMHSYKGREANDVYLPAFEDACFPARRDLSEEARLCYVAFTRARNRLFLSWVQERSNAYTGRLEKMDASRFLAVMDNNDEAHRLPPPKPFDAPKP